MKKNLHLILDCDGTLLPLRRNRKDLHLPEPVKKILERIDPEKLIVLSGRHNRDLKVIFKGLKFKLVGLNGFVPTEKHKRQSRAFKKELGKVLRQSHINPEIEDKKGLLSIHFRQAAISDGTPILKLAQKILKEMEFTDWHAYLGKKVVNVEPKASGKAHYVLDFLRKHRGQAVLFAGDDANDFPVMEQGHARLSSIFVSDRENKKYLKNCSANFVMPRREFLKFLKGLI